MHITDAKNAIWNFDSNGYGPFNSCYAAVDVSTGQIAYHLEPNNLKRVMGATSDLSTNELALYNIVWLIPTVYWSVSGDSLILSNDSNEGEAYAHTTTNNGTKIWKYIGIGVYEASIKTVNSKSCLMSQSGKSPSTQQTITNYDTYAQNTPGDAILWNFYEWTFLKMATYMVGMGKNTQEIWGSGGSAATTGRGDTTGPYVSSGGTSYSKVFVENSWGSVDEFIGSTVFDSSAYMYTERTSAGSTYTSTTGKDASGLHISFQGQYATTWITNTDKSAQYWDFPTTTTPTSNATNTSYPGDVASGYYSGPIKSYISKDLLEPDDLECDDQPIYGAPAACSLVVGGFGSNQFCGIARTYAGYNSTSTSTYIGTRLAYFLDGDTAAGHTVQYYYNGSKIIDEVVPNGGTITYTSHTVNGLIFCGWYTDPSLASQYFFSNNTAVNSDLTLYAQMAQPLTFTSSPVANATITYLSWANAIMFDSIGENTPYQVLWDFGDGTFSSEKTVYHTYAEPGTYKVKLSAYNYYGDVDTREYMLFVVENTDSSGTDNTYLYIGIAAAAILGFFVVTRIF